MSVGLEVGPHCSPHCLKVQQSGLTFSQWRSGQGICCDGAGNDMLGTDSMLVFAGRCPVQWTTDHHRLVHLVVQVQAAFCHRSQIQSVCEAVCCVYQHTPNSHQREMLCCTCFFPQGNIRRNTWQMLVTLSAFQFCFSRFCRDECSVGASLE